MRLGEAVVASIPTASDEPFTGKVTRVGGSVDPNTHRLLVRVADRGSRAQASRRHDRHLPDHHRQAGQFAEHSRQWRRARGRRHDDGLDAARTRPISSSASSSSACMQDGFVQMLEGVKEGEPVIVDGAIFVDNILNARPSD